MQELNKPEPSRVTVHMGFKRNMGNFENMDISVGLEASALAGESSGDAFDRVYAFVEGKLMEKFQETEEALRGAGSGEG